MNHRQLKNIFSNDFILKNGKPDVIYFMLMDMMLV